MKNNYLTQTQFGDKLGLSQPYISRLVNENKLSTNTDNKINELTGCIEFLTARFDTLLEKEQTAINSLIQQVKSTTGIIASSLRDRSYIKDKTKSKTANASTIPANISASFTMAYNKNSLVPNDTKDAINHNLSNDDNLSADMLTIFKNSFNQERR